MQEPVAEKIENNTGNAIAAVEVEGGGDYREEIWKDSIFIRCDPANVGFFGFFWLLEMGSAIYMHIVTKKGRMREGGASSSEVTGSCVNDGPLPPARS